MNSVKAFFSSPSRVAVGLTVVNHVAVFALVVLGHYNLPQVLAAVAEVAAVTQTVRKWLEGRSNWEQVVTQVGGVNPPTTPVEAPPLPQ